MNQGVSNDITQFVRWSSSAAVQREGSVHGAVHEAVRGAVHGAVQSTKKLELAIRWQDSECCVLGHVVQMQVLQRPTLSMPPPPPINPL